MDPVCICGERRNQEIGFDSRHLKIFYLLVEFFCILLSTSSFQHFLPSSHLHFDLIPGPQYVVIIRMYPGILTGSSITNTTRLSKEAISRRSSSSRRSPCERQRPRSKSPSDASDAPDSKTTMTSRTTARWPKATTTLSSSSCSNNKCSSNNSNRCNSSSNRAVVERVMPSPCILN